MADENIGRRRFLGTAAGAAAFSILKPQVVLGTQANSSVRVGLLGCGGRGTADATGMVESGDARVVALADMFKDQLDRAKQHFDKLAQSRGYSGVDASQMFAGPRAYEQIVSSKEVDAVVITSPPYFHPQHLDAAVTAGKHVYCEKPVAVDVAGAKRVIDIGKKAEGRLSLDVGFQIRMAPPFAELVQRIHKGALGDIVTGAAYYYCPHIDRPDWPGVSAAERRLRNWVHDRVLSGDIIVEQNIHVIDICNWVLRAHPEKAVGTGGQKGKGDQGNCFSHFDVVYFYPNDTHISFSSTQFGKGPFDANERFFGPRGGSASPYAGPLGIWGEEQWVWKGSESTQPGQFSATGSFSDNLAQADPEKHKAFIQSITTKQYHNQAATGAESALTAMLGRRAAYTGREATWDELLRSNEHWDSGIDLSKL